MQSGYKKANTHTKTPFAPACFNLVLGCSLISRVQKPRAPSQKSGTENIWIFDEQLLCVFVSKAPLAL